MTSRAAALAADFEAALGRFLAERYGGERTLPASVRYVLEGPGKRVRPVLCLLASEAVAGAPVPSAMDAALAVEMVHCYSLVHDDLPCMDDDDLRRGRPTAHKVYGEANALLTGDALLTDAFALLAAASGVHHPTGLRPVGAPVQGAEPPGPPRGEEAWVASGGQGAEPPGPPAVRLAMVAELATAAGGAGMVLGQSLDLHWTARPGATRAALDEIHGLKTGALLGAAAAMGALAGGGNGAVARSFRVAGRALGLAFQILDDLLDDAATTGKSAGKDQAAGKLTYLALMSPAEARAAADQATAAALAALADVALAPAGRAELEAFVGALLRRTR